MKELPSIPCSRIMKMPDYVLQESVRQLIEETENYEDALSYVDDLAEELSTSRKEVVKELDNQYYGHY
jgi:L-lactate utilization protein LutB